MTDVNLQNMTAAEYQAMDPGPSQQFTQYGEASQLPTRRQNVACDACRARKVKCVRKPMAEQVSAEVAGECGLAEMRDSVTIAGQRERLARESPRLNADPR